MGTHFLRVAAFAFLLHAAAVTSASAIVDPKNANYADTWIDISEQEFVFMRRTYNSRSLHDGIFGFGWCSDMETSLAFDRFPMVNYCGGGLEIELQTRVKTSDGVLYISADGRSQMLFDGQKYRFSGPPGWYEFSSDGRLVAAGQSDEASVQLEYSSKLVRKIRFSAGPIMDVYWNTDGKVAKIADNQGKHALYRYDNLGRLVEVTNEWGNTYSYRYDDGHNLTQVSFPDDTTKQLFYDVDRDWVTAFHDRDGCIESYYYEITPNDIRHYWTIAIKTCEGEPIIANLYEFIFGTVGKTGDNYLRRVRYTETCNFYDIEFNFEGQIVGRSKKRVGQLHELFGENEIATSVPSFVCPSEKELADDPARYEVEASVYCECHEPLIEGE